MGGMRKLRAGIAVSLVGSFLMSSLGAAAPNKGFLSGDARAETKQPYSDFAVRARNIADGTVQGTTVLDAQGNFKLDGLPAGKMMVELTRVGQNKVICSEGPFDIKPAASDQAFGKADISIACNQPIAAWLLVTAAAAAGITAGVVAGGNTASGAR
jgi:hypothetical protein